MEYIYFVQNEDINFDLNKDFISTMYGNYKDPDIRRQKELARNYTNALFNKIYYKCVDSFINKELERITKNFVAFIEIAHKIRVKKIICKILIDNNQKFYLIGAQEFYYDLFHSGNIYTYSGKIIIGLYNVDLIKEKIKQYANGIKIEELDEIIASNKIIKKSKWMQQQVEISGLYKIISIIN